MNCSLSGLPETKITSSGVVSKKRRRVKDNEGADADFGPINSELQHDSKGEEFKSLLDGDAGGNESPLEKAATPFTILLHNEDAFFSVLEFFVHPNAFRSPSEVGSGLGIGGFGLRPANGGFSGSGSSRGILSSRRSNLKDIASLFCVNRVFREKVREGESEGVGRKVAIARVTCLLLSNAPFSSNPPTTCRWERRDFGGRCGRAYRAAMEGAVRFLGCCLLRLFACSLLRPRGALPPPTPSPRRLPPGQLPFRTRLSFKAPELR